MFPAIYKLDLFLTEILMPIFADVDDIGLLHITSINQRIEAIAQVVFNQRYADKYSVIKGESESDREELLGTVSSFRWWHQSNRSK